MCECKSALQVLDNAKGKNNSFGRMFCYQAFGGVSFLLRKPICYDGVRVGSGNFVDAQFGERR